MAKRTITIEYDDKTSRCQVGTSDPELMNSDVLFHGIIATACRIRDRTVDAQRAAMAAKKIVPGSGSAFPLDINGNPIKRRS